MLQSKDTDWLNGYKNKTHIYAVYKKPTWDLQTNRLKVRGWKNIFHSNGKQKKVGVAILISDKIDLKIKITRDKEGHYIMFKGLILEEDITIVNIYAPNVKSWLIGKDSDAGRDWGQEEKGTTEDEMAGWHHRLDGCEFEWTPGVGDGQGGLACCGSWGRKESDTTEWLNWTELNWCTQCRSTSIHKTKTRRYRRWNWQYHNNSRGL